jgi:hypothetical protein
MHAAFVNCYPKLCATTPGRRFIFDSRSLELAICRYCGEPGFWGKAHARCQAIAGVGRREIRTAIRAALADESTMGAIRRIVEDIALRSRLPERETRTLVIEEYLGAVDRLYEGGVNDIELEDRLTELQRKFGLTRSECMRTAA